MDCRTARCLLDFARPQSAELHPSEADALDSHLNGCLECDALFRQERQIDAHIGRAVRDVPVPQGLRQRLVDQLARDQRARFRRLAVRGAALASAAAAVMLVSVGLWQWWTQPRPIPVDVDALHEQSLREIPPLERAEEWLQDKYGEGATALRFIQSRPLNYNLLTSYKLLPVAGQPTPWLEFVSDGKQGRAVLQMYVLPLAKYDPKGVRVNSQGLTLEVVFDDDKNPQFAYVLIYPSTSGLKPFFADDGGPPG